MFIRYACVFCAQAGSTIHECDATVFLSEDEFFRHLSRHPQPLPEIPGVTILYGKVDSDDPKSENYDLHFPGPPAPNPVPSMALGCFPSATATKNNIRRIGENPIFAPDGTTEALKFLVGARIVGVEFPGQWGGKWCLGWHDGVHGAFPAGTIEIEAPRQSEISMQSNSGVVVTARWKWEPKNKGGTDWLSLDKGEIIKNVGCKCLFWL